MLKKGHSGWRKCVEVPRVPPFAPAATSNWHSEAQKGAKVEAKSGTFFHYEAQNELASPNVPSEVAK